MNRDVEARKIVSYALALTLAQRKPGGEPPDDWLSIRLDSVLTQNEFEGFIWELNEAMKFVYSDEQSKVIDALDSNWSGLLKLTLQDGTGSAFVNAVASQLSLYRDLKSIAEAAKELMSAEFEPLEELWSSIQLAVERGKSKPVDLIGALAKEPVKNATLVGVFYATDRLEQRTGSNEVDYDHDRSLAGVLHYGRCEVSIPHGHQIGKIESPSFIRFEFRADPSKHITLSRKLSLSESEFFESVRTFVGRSELKDAFVFVHGYNVSFEDAARRCGQIAHDLDFVGAPIFYSWPSNGRVADYLKDETNIGWSTPHFQHFLSLLAEHSGAERIHVIAHSMGNRAVCDALKVLSHDHECRLMLNHLVLAAPDIDADTFRELAHTLKKLSRRVTLYESSRDKAIHVSKRVHGNARAGEPLLIVAGVDTIDSSLIDTDFLGHAYFGDSWPLLSDIHAMLHQDVPPMKRFGIEERTHIDGKYYAFRG